MIIRCIVIEDEPLAQDILKNYISKVPFLELAGMYNSPVAAQSDLHEIRPDLIFLDINLPTLSGVNFLRSLQQPPAVVFTTAYQDFALEGFELNAVDYLLKPFSFERFLKAINKVTEKLQSGKAADPHPDSTDAIFIKVEKRLVRVGFDDIILLEALDDYVKVVTWKKEYLTNNSLKNMTEQLPSNLFMRVHKSYVVAKSAIDYIEGNYIKAGDREIPIGAAFKDEVISLFRGKKKS